MAEQATGWVIHGIRDEDGRLTIHGIAFNDRMNRWGLMACQTLGLSGDLNYAIRAAYVEYENVASPSDPVTVPTVLPTDTVAYYQSLSTSPTRDYLRVTFDRPPAIEIIGGYESDFEAGEGNQLAFTIVCNNTVGVNGKPFTNGANSKVCGIALVGTPVPDDPAQDIVFCRLYYGPSQQLIKPANGHFEGLYKVPFAND